MEGKELTVLQVLSETKIPAQYQNDLEAYPHVKEFFTILKKGRTKKALLFYEFFINRKEFYLDKAGIVNARTRRGNKKIRATYGSSWRTKRDKIFRPTLYRIQQGLCKMCHKWFSEKDLEVDHIYKINVENGKKDDLRNMQLLCVKCHDEKDNMKKGDERGFITGKNGTPWTHF
jgi:hypothetical protein